MPGRPEDPEKIESGPDPLPRIEREITVLVRRSMESLWSSGYGEHPDVDRFTYPVLVMLDEHGPQLLTELTHRIGLTKPTVSRHVTRLGAAGLVDSSPDATDPRAVRLRLTPAGSARAAEIREARLAPLRAFLQTWPDADLSTLADLIGRLNRDLDQHQAPGGLGHLVGPARA